MSQEAVEEDAGPNIEGDGNEGAPEPEPLPNGWQMVVRELVQTERAYVNDIGDVIAGYFDYLPRYYKPRECVELPMSAEERDALFGNLKELAEFNSMLLTCFEAADGQPDEVAECFLTKMEDFKIYALYCTNYVQAMDTFNLLQKRPRAEEYFQHCQVTLGHTLPLDSFLLKPVQRVLKYPLLLSSLIKQYAKFPTPVEETRQRLLDAHKTMSNLAQYINEVKQAKEEKKRTDEIMSKLIGWDNRLDTGTICVEDQIRVFGVKGEQHHLYAFQNMLLITKPMKDCPALFRRHLFYADITLADISAEPFLFELHCPKEQADAVTARSTRLFPIVVCPRNAKQKALWLRTLSDMGVADVTAEVEAARKKVPAGDANNPLSPSSSGLSKPRHSFIQVISQVQRAASLNSYNGHGHLSHFRSEGRQSESDLLSTAAKVGKVCSTEGVFAAASVDARMAATTRRKWEELISTARQSSHDSPTSIRRARGASASMHKSEKTRSPHFWRKASSTDKLDRSCSKSEFGGMPVKSDLSTSSCSATLVPVQLSLRVTSETTMSTSSIDLPHSLIEQCRSSPDMERSVSLTKGVESTSSLPVRPSELESPVGSRPASPLSGGKKSLRNRYQFKDALKSAGKLISPRRIHSSGAGSRLDEHLSPTSTSEFEGKSVSDERTFSSSSSFGSGLRPDDIDSSFSSTNIKPAESTTSSRMRSGSISFQLPSWATGSATHPGSRLDEHLSPASTSESEGKSVSDERTFSSSSSFGSGLRPDDIDSSFSSTNIKPAESTTSSRMRSGSISFQLPSWATGSATPPKHMSKAKRASAPTLLKAPSLKMEGEPIRDKPPSRLGRLAEKTRERRNSISNYCTGSRKGSTSLPGSTDVF